ncbi:hypothetical protein [Microbaculum marinum]|uniref:Uncharacterized protein n=1 Tax=Microbaculum marinum TaxID=1764581 RepID=A0AAW9R9W9_9HYPH
MTAAAHRDDRAAPRPPDEVMRLARMGAFFPTRLSFMRTLLRRLSAERAVVHRAVWEIDDAGFGRAVYSVPLGGHTYSLVAFSTPLAPEDRTDRVIAEAWDTSYVLYDGVPAPGDLDRLQANAPRQEAGRFSATDLVLCRANRSVRLFEHVADCLSRGVQPPADVINATGYLMRTTAVYGNGKFGIADRARIETRPGLSGPFAAEMLAVWLVRGFTIDLVEHIARSRAPDSFVPLDRALKRHLGIGNATGLGMAPFLVSHPILLDRWMTARETALARVRAVPHASPEARDKAEELIARVRRHLDQWRVADARQSRRIEVLRREVADLAALATRDWLAGPFPWDRLVAASMRHSLECQELVVSLVLEPNGALVDDLADTMASAGRPRLRPEMPVAALTDLVDSRFAWALGIDFEDREATDRFWYVSEEKLEPRLGSRHQEPGADKEMPLDIARQVQALRRELAAAPASQTVAEFLLARPAHRHAVRRVQTAADHPYAEIRDNLIAADCLPIDMLRCKLSFFGAAKFDPKSDRWTRITMFQGAPLLDEIATPLADDWWLSALEGL